MTSDRAGAWWASIREFLHAAERKGGEVSLCDGTERSESSADGDETAGHHSSPELSIDAFAGGRPRTDVDRAAWHNVLPPPLVRPFDIVADALGAKGHAYWTFGRSISRTLDVPSELRDNLWGGPEADFDASLSPEDSRRGWMENQFYAKLVEWREAIGLFDVPNGDLWAVSTSASHMGQVIYLDHDDCRHIVLGPDLLTVMDHWTHLGCVGPEWWLMAPFLDPQHGLDSRGPAARRFREALGLAP